MLWWALLRFKSNMVVRNVTGRPEHLKTFVLSFSSFSEMRASPCRPLLTSSVSGVSRKLQHEQPTKKTSKIVRIGEKAGEKNLCDITTNKRWLKKSRSWQVAKIQKEKDQNGQTWQITVMDQMVHIWFVFQVVALLQLDLWSPQDSGGVLVWGGHELVGLLKLVDSGKVSSEDWTSAQCRVPFMVGKSSSKNAVGVYEWRRTRKMFP